MKTLNQTKFALLLLFVLSFAVVQIPAQVPAPTSAPSPSGSPTTLPTTPGNTVTLSAMLEELIINFVAFKSAFISTVEGTLGSYFALLAYILAWIIAIYYFIQQFVRGEWDSAEIGRFTGRLVLCLMLLIFCGDVDGDGKRGDIVRAFGYVGYHLAHGQTPDEPSGNFISRTVETEQNKFNTNYDAFVENKLMVKINERDMPVKYPGMQGVQTVAAVYTGQGTPQQQKEAESQEFWIGLEFQILNLCRSIIGILDFFLLVLYSFGILVMSLIAPFMVCVFVNRELAKRFTYPFLWSVFTICVIFPVLAQASRYFAYLSGNMALGTSGNPNYTFDPTTYTIISNGDPTPMILVAVLCMLISILFLAMSMVLSYSLVQGKLVESMNGLIANTFAGLSSVGLSAIVSGYSTKLSNEGETKMIGAQQDSTMIRADAQLKNQEDSAKNAKAVSDQMTEAQYRQQMLGAEGQRQSSQMSAYGQALQGFASVESQRIGTVNGAIASAANTIRNLDKDEKTAMRNNYLDHLDKTNTAESRELAERIRTQPEVFDLVAENYKNRADKLGLIGSVATTVVGKDTVQAWSYENSSFGNWLFGDAKKGTWGQGDLVGGKHQQEIFQPNTPLFEGADGKYYNAITGNQVKLPPSEQSNNGNLMPQNGGQIAELNGVPLFKQGDPRWGGRQLGSGSSLSAAGCAMSSTAMSISQISGKNINPGQLDSYLDQNGGYSGNGLNWNVAARSVGLSAQKTPWSAANVNKQLDSGKSVVVGVDYKGGSRGGANGTDHWVTLTGRKGETYFANDPATGKAITMQMSGGQLIGGRGSNGNPYKTTGQLVTFSGGLSSQQLLQKRNSSFSSPTARMQPITAYQGGSSSLPNTTTRSSGVQFNDGQAVFKQMDGVTNPAVVKVLAKHQAARVERDNTIAGSRINMERRNQVVQQSTSEGRQIAQTYMQDSINNANQSAQISRSGVEGSYQMSVKASDTNFQYQSASANVGRSSGTEVNQMNYDTSMKVAQTQFGAESRAAQVLKDASLENLYKKNMAGLVQTVGNSAAHQLSELFERASRGM